MQRTLLPCLVSVAEECPPRAGVWWQVCREDVWRKVGSHWVPYAGPVRMPAPRRGQDAPRRKLFLSYLCTILDLEAGCTAPPHLAMLGWAPCASLWASQGRGGRPCGRAPATGRPRSARAPTCGVSTARGHSLPSALRLCRPRPVLSSAWCLAEGSQRDSSTLLGSQHNPRHSCDGPLAGRPVLGRERASGRSLGSRALPALFAHLLCLHLLACFC